ncbi:unnamed protein product [Bursaphelenchus okinawaensis]|uniref:U6 small nuclear RNA (adenine-(43)-N(6))-methyltransferase n=1 Tax=Bursaphelenchus okinawaensis TaxID=465554 RepID=A0A811LL26_9BILA|nr:unnamed protein product [Bursaphelenchus okinawaensis]CAG9123676.1 unnamed protein product [Bursaphelenchus okinawaensis]
MHDRNMYKKHPPDFKKLALKYPEFRKLCKLSTTGNVSGDFGNEQFVKLLSEILLKKDFELDVEFMSGSLIPRIPQRLNYLLLIDDILRANGITENVTGLDIGTGASCIYPLIGAKLLRYRFIATDVDEKSVEWACQQTKKNFKYDEIRILLIENEKFFEEPLKQVDKLDFCMCNPPFFYESEGNLKFERNSEGTYTNTVEPTVSAPRSITVAKGNELMTSGGEVQFVKAIVDESVLFKDKVKVFTSMVGKISSIKVLTACLKDVGCKTIGISRLSQGNTQRGVLIWSFDDNFKIEGYNVKKVLVVDKIKQETSRKRRKRKHTKE